MDEEIIDVKTHYETPFKIELEAIGNISISINNNVMHFYNLEKPIIIDGELMNVSDGSGTNMNNCMVGDFPKLQPGSNAISVMCDESSTFNKLSLEYRSLWL